MKSSCHKCNKTVNFVGVVDADIIMCNEGESLVSVCNEHLEELEESGVCDIILDVNAFVEILKTGRIPQRAIELENEE